MHIVCDLDGGDNAPNIVIDATVSIAEKFQNAKFTLVGTHSVSNISLPNNVSVEKLTEKIGTEEDPLKAIRSKKSSSIVIGCKMVKNKEADVFISAGNTGALMASGLFNIGRIKGISRPALATIFPTITNKSTLILDVGANLEVKPEYLVEYALAAKCYVENMQGIINPRVGLLNIGIEPAKGTEALREAYLLLNENKSINFVGNVEARDILCPPCDIIVCDGFHGNIALKTTEGVAKSIFDLLKQEISSSFSSKLAGGFLKKNFKNILSILDYREYGGAPLLGLDGAVFKAHGSSDVKAFSRAIEQSILFIEEKVLDKMKVGLL